MNDDDEKRIQNLFKTLQKDSKSVFYANSNISKNVLKKFKKSTYQKDRVFSELYQKLEDKNFNVNDPANIDAPSKFYKASTDNIPFFNREKIFTIYKRAKLNNGSYLYWLEDQDWNKIGGRFLRQELFALDKQFEE